MEEKCRMTAALLRMFKLERRVLYSELIPRDGPPPKPNMEEASLMLSIDMRQCRFTGNKYGSMLLARHDGKSEDLEKVPLGTNFCWGTTLEKAIGDQHKKSRALEMDGNFLSKVSLDLGLP